MEAEEEGGSEAAPRVAARHIKKRVLRNKALAIGFDDKSLRDYITGFHKRKKKRRKQAQKQIEEKERLKRIELRKKRKLEKELALFGGALPAENQQATSSGPTEYTDDGLEPPLPVSGTKMYESGDTTITVTTSELSREDEDPGVSLVIPRLSIEAEKKPGLPVQKTPFKKAVKQGSQHRSKKEPKKSAPPKRGKKNTKRR